MNHKDEAGFFFFRSWPKRIIGAGRRGDTKPNVDSGQPDPPPVMVSLSAAQAVGSVDLDRALAVFNKVPGDLSSATHVSRNGTVFHIKVATSGKILVYLDSDILANQPAST